MRQRAPTCDAAGENLLGRREEVLAGSGEPQPIHRRHLRKEVSTKAAAPAAAQIRRLLRRGASGTRRRLIHASTAPATKTLITEPRENESTSAPKEHRAAGEQQLARDRRFLPRARERHRDHHQEKRAEVAQRAGFVKQALRAAVDAGIQPDELRPVAGRGGELKVEIDAGEERGERRKEIDAARGAPSVEPRRRAIRGKEEDVNRDADQRDARKTGGRGVPAGMKRGHRNAGKQRAEERRERGVQPARANAPMRERHYPKQQPMPANSRQT